MAKVSGFLATSKSHHFRNWSSIISPLFLLVKVLIQFQDVCGTPPWTSSQLWNNRSTQIPMSILAGAYSYLSHCRDSLSMGPIHSCETLVWYWIHSFFGAHMRGVQCHQCYIGYINPYFRMVLHHLTTFFLVRQNNHLIHVIIRGIIIQRDRKVNPTKI